jgi:transposase
MGTGPVIRQGRDTEMGEQYIGVDVSKGHLDVASSDGESFRVTNDESGHEQVVARFRVERPTLVLLEATGGLERALAVQLSAAGVALRIVNARHVRHFAKATGLLARTDRLDAQALVRFAQTLKPEPRPIEPEQTVALQALIGRRRQLVEMLSMERNRLRTAHRGVRPDLQASIRWLEKRLAGVDNELDRVLRDCGGWREKVELLESVPGVGRVISVSLLASIQGRIYGVPPGWIVSHGAPPRPSSNQTLMQRNRVRRISAPSLHARAASRPCRGSCGSA